MSKLHWLALRSVPGVGAATASQLIQRLGNIEAVFTASDSELVNVPRITPEVVASLRNIVWESLEAEMLSLAEEGIELLTRDDDGYPKNLRQSKDSPLVLFVRGNLLPQDERAVAIVGTRQRSAYAVEQTDWLAAELSARSWTIVSGLADGIDTAAHRGALKTPGGRTLAVLGSGLRMIHPAHNLPLAQEIAQRGALVSESLPDSPPRGPQLMARDRIVSGLSLAVTVMEAGEQSGSMDTALKARRQGRRVLAVPGSPGADALIAQGATPLVVDAVDFDVLDRELDGPAPAVGSVGSKQLTLW
jgi:DNA processing protein